MGRLARNRKVPRRDGRGGHEPHVGAAQLVAGLRSPEGCPDRSAYCLPLTCQRIVAARWADVTIPWANFDDIT